MATRYLDLNDESSFENLNDNVHRLDLNGYILRSVDDSPVVADGPLHLYTPYGHIAAFDGLREALAWLHEQNERLLEIGSGPWQEYGGFAGALEAMRPSFTVISTEGLVRVVQAWDVDGARVAFSEHPDRLAGETIAAVLEGSHAATWSAR